MSTRIFFRRFPVMLAVAGGLFLPVSASCGGASQTQDETVSKAEPTPEPAPAASEPFYLAGAIEVPSVELTFFAHLEPNAAGGYEGTLDIPMQNAKDAPLSNVMVAGGQIAFSLEGADARWVAAKQSDGQYKCSFSQGGKALPCSIREVDRAQWAKARAPQPRPQTPKEPFPYDTKEVDYKNEEGGAHLFGTLTVPEGDGPFPTALLITSSGAQDRDETIVGHKPFWVIADHLARKGIASLRVDDRGVGKSTGASPEDTTEDFAEDARAAVAYLRSKEADERIDRKYIGLIGHSEGAMIASMLAAKDRKLAFIVLLAGTGVDGSEVLIAQAGALKKLAGADEEEVEAERASQRLVVEAVTKNKDDEMAKTKVIEILKERGGHDAINAQAASALVSPWFRFFLSFDPIPTLKKVRVPTLVMHGEKDVQVDLEQNLPLIEKALKRNKRAKVVRFAELNHLFQHADTGAPGEYAKIEETFAPEALQAMSDWILEVTNSSRATGAGRKPGSK